MAKVPIVTIENLQNEPSAVAGINRNFSAIQAVIETLLSRDGTSPNQMVNLLDMNLRRIVNLPPPVDPFDAVRFIDIGEFVIRAEDAADHAEEMRDEAVVLRNETQNLANQTEELRDETSELLDHFLNLYDRQYDISFFIQGLLVENETLFEVTFSRLTELPEDLPDTVFRAGVPSQGTTTSIEIYHEDTLVGSVVFEEAEEYADLVFGNTVIIQPGETLSLRTTGTVDSALANISGTLRGFRLAEED